MSRTPNAPHPPRPVDAQCTPISTPPYPPEPHAYPHPHPPSLHTRVEGRYHPKQPGSTLRMPPPSAGTLSPSANESGGPLPPPTTCYHPHTHPRHAIHTPRVVTTR